jgi:hypothetical protein
MAEIGHPSILMLQRAFSHRDLSLFSISSPICLPCTYIPSHTPYHRVSVVVAGAEREGCLSCWLGSSLPVERDRVGVLSFRFSTLSRWEGSLWLLRGRTLYRSESQNRDKKSLKYWSNPVLHALCVSEQS